LQTNTYSITEFNMTLWQPV